MASELSSSLDLAKQGDFERLVGIALRGPWLTTVSVQVKKQMRIYGSIEQPNVMGCADTLAKENWYEETD